MDQKPLVNLRPVDVFPAFVLEVSIPNQKSLDSLLSMAKTVVKWEPTNEVALHVIKILKEYGYVKEAEQKVEGVSGKEVLGQTDSCKYREWLQERTMHQYRGRFGSRVD